MKYPHTYILIPYTPDRRGRLIEAMTAIQENTNPEITPYSIVSHENNYIGYPSAILDMVEAINGFVFMGASDIILGKGWLRILWEKMEEVGRDKIVEPFNEIQQGNLVQHPLLHSDLVKKYFHRHYFHFYCDNEMTDRAVADGLYFYFSDIEENQDEGLPALQKEGLTWKFSDEDSRKKPCDGGCFPPLPSFLVIKFSEKFYFVQYDRIQEMRDGGEKSITEEEAHGLSTLIVRIKT